MLHEKNVQDQIEVISLGELQIEIKGRVNRDLLFCEVLSIKAASPLYEPNAWIPRDELSAELATDDDLVVMLSGDYLNGENFPPLPLLDFFKKRTGKSRVLFLCVFEFIEFSYGFEHHVSKEQIDAVNNWCKKESAHFIDFDRVGGSSPIHVAMNIALAQQQLIEAFNLPPAGKGNALSAVAEPERAKPSVKVKKQQVYVIGNQEYGVIKIGVAVNPKTRLKAVQTGCPYPLSLLTTSTPKSDAKKIEQKLHHKLSQYRLSGEWFRYEAYKEIDWKKL